MDQIFDNEFSTIYFDKTNGIVKLVWKENPKLSLETYKISFNAALDFQEQNIGKTKYFISDIRKQKIMSPDTRKWFQEEALPKAIKNGLLKGAAIFDGDVFKKYYLNNIMNSSKKFGLPFKFFNNEEKAIDWFINE